MTNARIFFAGVGTAILLIGAGFSGGLMLAKTAMEPVAASSSRAVADRLPPARVILPASAEAASPPQPPFATVAAPEGEPASRLIQTNEVQQSRERDRAAERAERRKAEAERRKLVAERKAKRDGARIAKQQQEQQQAPGIMAFGEDDEHPPVRGGFFGN
jgi:type IV secretory pathway VirB10-like protein